MLKQHSSFVKQAIAAVDCVLLAVSLYLSYQVVSRQVHLSPLPDYWVMFIGFLAFYLYFAWTRQLFSILYFTWMSGLINRVIAIFFSAGILGAAILYTIPDQYNSRRLYILFTAIAFIFIAVEKLLLKEIFARFRRRNFNISTVLLFGRGRNAAHITKEIQMHPEWGLRITRTIDLGVAPHEFEKILMSSYVEEVFFCIPRSLSINGFSIDAYLQICEEMGRPARVFMNIADATHFARWEFQRFLNRPTLVSHTAELDPDQLLFKRIFDITGACTGLCILAVIFPFLAAAVKLTSPGPLLFKQVRVGKNGKRFIIYKFRSMVVNAPLLKQELEKKNELKGAIFKVKDDPRITPIGRFMRKFSLDELPQFINILRGEMSLVGTRPPTPDEVSQYQKWHHRRISIKPGLTGLWQVSGRNKINDFDEIVKLDLRYIDTWSLWQDIQIILKTIVVLFKKGEAY
jgi:exopolysaccharide biosynthesis polyprenyl glycosylphosphotransferase